MTTILKIWADFSATFQSGGYALFNIEAHLACVFILIILWLRGQNSSDQTEASIIWARLLFVQILYCMSGIFRVMADIGILPDTSIINYLVTAINFGLFGCICWLVFVYIELYEKNKILSSRLNLFFSALPFCFNVVMLIASPFTNLYLDISGANMKTGLLFPLMVIINLSYPVIAVVLSIMRRRAMTQYERSIIPMMAVYPALFMICGPLQALNWRMPFLCYAIVISDIFVYISYADSLVSVDPLTKIPNKNGLIRNLTVRLGQENPECLYLFIIDVDNLSAINSNFGRSEGDRALMIIAGALKKFRSEEHSCYTSRYYGDRFVITADIQDNEELELFIEHIKNYISNAAVSAGLQYYLRVNIGWSKYETFSKTETISGLIEEAEKVLNENKEQRKFQNIWRAGKAGE